MTTAFFYMDLLYHFTKVDSRATSTHTWVVNIFDRETRGKKGVAAVNWFGIGVRL